MKRRKRGGICVGSAESKGEKGEKKELTVEKKEEVTGQREEVLGLTDRPFDLILAFLCSSLHSLLEVYFCF